MAAPDTFRKAEGSQPGWGFTAEAAAAAVGVGVRGGYVRGGAGDASGHQGTIVSVPEIARNSARSGRCMLRVQMPQPAKVDLFVEAEVATGSRLKVSVSSRVYAVERQ